MSPTLTRLLLSVLLASLGLAGCRATLAPTDRVATSRDVPVLAIATPPRDWRALVGLRVRIDAPLTVTGNHRLARHGEVIASFGGRLFAPTERALPGLPAAAAAASNQDRQLLLALGEAGGPLSSATGRAPWRNGTVLGSVEGIVHARQDTMVLQVDRPLRVTSAPRPRVPVVRGDVRLASMNLQNLFNGDGRGTGFPTGRGARTYDAYLHQRGKLVAAIRALDADVVALMELESDGEGPDSSLAQLVAALSSADGAWQFVGRCAPPCRPADAGFGDQPIRVGLIYRADRVSLVGAPATLSGGPFDARSRIPLAQAFRAGDGPVFTVAAVHLKSKGCSEAEGLDRDQHDGQACWNATRADSARRLAAWLKTDPTRSGSDLVAIIGDLNAYAKEDPVQALRRAGWVDALQQPEHAYSYVYDGQAGRLDHVLVTPALAGRIIGAGIWHINADEPANVGDPDANPSTNAMTPWRSSDHDPLLVGLRLRAP